MNLNFLSWKILVGWLVSSCYVHGYAEGKLNNFVFYLVSGNIQIVNKHFSLLAADLSLFDVFLTVRGRVRGFVKNSFSVK